ncbi:hypothetical protein V495_02056 [Pseudogymnoascus sp. VKM F-4514 (FW-929)]|nr:hypothetical protein V490_06727 [Pseudogymnoascus sp. VKM F-3557]KFY47204.1 hypothetical protein V495_02056 [Pseudogymnoascus sp. VKM F-4514 (FW-929)]KFY61063.1 hypothetical protein V497_03189 [Pseudogymnoascus sp. VKM F-4516 (FW-969)]
MAPYRVEPRVEVTAQLAVEEVNPDLGLPRILCLHGGGTNDRIFRAQCRALINHLRHEFRLVFAQAPFDSEAGPDVLSVYNEWGPFRRWLCWHSEHRKLRPQDACRALDQSLDDAMRYDNETGATGDWVAVLGFSQGAKIAASLLYRQQVYEETRRLVIGTTSGHATQNLQPPDRPKFRFGILLAGSAPLVSLDPNMTLSHPLPDATSIRNPREEDSGGVPEEGGGNVLRIPTIHVHGVLDPGLTFHRKLFEHFCHPATRRLVEWDGAHRVPLKNNDVLSVVHQIRKLAKETETKV